MSPSQAEAEEMKSLAPVDLARGYAELAFDTRERLRKLEADVDHTRGVALAAHGLAAETRARVEDIAQAVRARAARVSLPPPTEKLDIDYTSSPTGTHAIVSHQELERIQRKFAEKEAEERGAKLYATQLLEDEETSRKRSKESRDRWLFVVAIASTLAAFVTYALGHVSLH